MQKCTRCKKSKELKEFYKGAPWCILCRKEWNQENKDKISFYGKTYDSREVQKRFYDKNKEKYFTYKRKRRKENIEFKLIENTRSRIYHIIKRNKDKNTIKYLGCSISRYKLYLESLFTSEMNWSNYGIYWEIDHIMPIFTFDFNNEISLFEAFNWLNTRPLSKEENRTRSKKEF